MIAIPLIEKIAELFLILFAGVVLVRSGLLKAKDSRVLSVVSLYFVSPCVIFNSFQKELTPAIQQGLLAAVLMAVGFQLFFFLITAVLGRVWKATEVERASIAFTNCGNLIVPLVAHALGQEWVIYVSGFIFVFNILFWTVGLRMYDRESRFNVRRLLLNPNVLAVLLGALTLFLGIRLPRLLAIVLADVSGLIGPVSMLITGMVVGGMKLRAVFGNRRIFLVVFFRMVLCSGLAMFLAVLAGLPGRIPDGKQIVLISLLSAMAPSASNNNQLAILYDRDAEYASAINVMTTLACIVTVPLWVMVYERLVP